MYIYFYNLNKSDNCLHVTFHVLFVKLQSDIQECQLVSL